MNALDGVLAALERKGQRVRPQAGYYMAQCPAHDDTQASLSVRGADGKVLLNCHAGCTTEDVAAAIGMNLADLFDATLPRDKPITIAEYRYTDETGALLYTVERRIPKTFRMRAADGSYRLTGVRRVLYRLPDVTAAAAEHGTIYVVEGEKDVDNLTAAGVVATCNPNGAGKWREEYSTSLLGAQVVVIADTDQPGRDHAQAVAVSLIGKALSVTLALPAAGKDITDHFAAGLGLHQLAPFHPGPTTENGTAEQAASNGHATGRHIILTAADTMTMKAPRWLWDRRIPAGAITLLAGREGIGKSTIAFDLAARLTRGELEGTRYGRPAGVAVVATEDQWAEVILPRLVAAHADLSRVYQVEAADPDEVPESITVPADLSALKVVCGQHDIALLILDPIMSVLDVSLDTHKDREVRRALDPLARFAAESDAAVIGSLHVNKSAGTDPNNSMMGSRAFPAVARSVLYCIADPESEEGAERYLFCHTKSNLGPKQPSIGYQLQEAGILLDEATGEMIPTSRVRWGAEDKRTAADVMETPRDRLAGELATTILEWMQAPDRVLPVSAVEIVSNFPSEKPDTVRKNLNRMAARGTLTKPLYGHFALPLPVVPPELDTQVGHPRATPSYVSKLSKVSKDLEELDRLDGTDTLDGTGDVSNLPSQPTSDDDRNHGPCAACGQPSSRPADNLCFICWTRGVQPTEPTEDP